MLVFLRLYSFHRRCNMPVSRAAKRAFQTVVRDWRMGRAS